MAPKVPTVYKVTNLLNGRIYVGKHLADAVDPLSERYLGSGVAIKRAVAKYGRHNFLKEILAICDTEEEAYEIEQVLVDPAFVSSDRTYNGIEGGKGLTSDFVKDLLAKRYSNAEYCEKHACIMREIAKRPDVKERRVNSMKIVRSQDWYQEKMRIAYQSTARSKKLSDSMKSSWSENPEKHTAAIEKRSLNKEWLRKISEANRKRAEDPVHRAKQAAILSGVKATQEWKDAHAAGIKNRSDSDQWLANLRASAKARANDPAHKTRMMEHNQRLKHDAGWRSAVAASKQSPEYRVSASARAAKKWSDQEYKAARIAALRKKREESPGSYDLQKQSASKANAKPVTIDGIKFDRMQDASKALGITMYKLRKLIQSGAGKVTVD